MTFMRQGSIKYISSFLFEIILNPEDERFRLKSIQRSEFCRRDSEMIKKGMFSLFYRKITATPIIYCHVFAEPDH